MRWTALAVVLLLLAAMAGPAAAGPAAVPVPGVRILLDGSLLAFDTVPLQVADRILVPLRGIFEALGATVRWDPAALAVQARRGETTVDLGVGAATAEVNGRTVALDVPAQIYRDRTMVPLRFVAEALGARVEWDSATRTVRITGPAGEAPAQPGSGSAPDAPPGPDAAGLWTLALTRNTGLDLRGSGTLEVSGGGAPTLSVTESVDLRVRGDDFHLEQEQRTGPAGAPARGAAVQTGRAGRSDRQYALAEGTWQLLSRAARPTGLTLLGLADLPVPGFTPAAYRQTYGTPALAGPVAGGVAELRLEIPAGSLVQAWTRRLPLGVAPGGAPVVRESAAAYWIDPATGSLKEMGVSAVVELPLRGPEGAMEPLRLRLTARLVAAPAQGPLPALGG